ncbi:MAG: hypothetical protein NTV73_07855 [Hyphomicrobiales bacterium]|nr:hypothetical protein [Hyphomicrobiales bacterium]
MDIGEPSGDLAISSGPQIGKRDRRYSVLVALNSEQMAAAEGWRCAHGIADQADALGELIRIGLLSEIAKIYRLVSDNSSTTTGRARNVSELARRKAAPKHQAG